MVPNSITTISSILQSTKKNKDLVKLVQLLPPPRMIECVTWEKKVFPLDKKEMNSAINRCVRGISAGHKLVLGLLGLFIIGRDGMMKSGMSRGITALAMILKVLLLDLGRLMR